jgi:hypothetical protein
MSSYTYSLLFKGGDNFAAISKFLELSLNASDNLMSDPQMRKLLDEDSTKFDVVLATIIPGSEIAYFLAHKFKAQLVIYCTAQG